jgi:tetratricopeptide (TPR) repeat protein
MPGVMRKPSPFSPGPLNSQPEHPICSTSRACGGEARPAGNAERHLRRLIALKPESPQGYNALGYTFADHNIRLDEAAELVDKALALSPDDSFILDSKGWVLFRQGKLARRRSSTCKELTPSSPTPKSPRISARCCGSSGGRRSPGDLARGGPSAFPTNEALNATIKRFVP